MPALGLRQTFKLETRNKYTTVDCEVGMKIDGKELPNTAILGEALDQAIALIQAHITESYKEVPARDGTTPSPAPVAPVTPQQEVVPPEPVQPITHPSTVPDFG